MPDLALLAQKVNGYMITKNFITQILREKKKKGKKFWHITNREKKNLVSKKTRLTFAFEEYIYVFFNFTTLKKNLKLVTFLATGGT